MTKFGLFYEMQQAKPWNEDHDYRTYWDALEQVKLAEQMGYDYIWVTEHHFLTEFAHSGAAEVFLAAAAQQTSRIRLGRGVALLPPAFNHPFRLAEQAAGLDIMSNGRIEFGTGRAVTVEELGGFNIDLAKTRAMWEEVVKLIPEMWTNEVFPGFKGEFVDLPERAVWPKPVQRPHPPMWMAATNPASYEVAGKYGLGLLCFVIGDPHTLKPMIDVYREAVSKCTNPAGKFVNDQVAVAIVTNCAEDRNEARRVGGEAAMFYSDFAMRKFLSVAGQPGYEDYKRVAGEQQEAFAALAGKYENLAEPLADLGVFCIGDPDDCLKTAELYRDQGVDQLIMIQQMGNLSHERVCKSIELIGDQVIPKMADDLPLAKTTVPKWLTPQPGTPRAT